MQRDLKILFVDDAPADIDVEQHELKRSGLAFTARTAASERELRRELIEFDPDVVLCDHPMGNFSGLRALEIIRMLRSSTPVLMISGSIIEDTAIECLNRGATDYVLKSNLRRLGPAVRRAAAEARRQVELQDRIEQLSHYDTLTGLPNLSLIDQMVCRAIEQAGHSSAVLALVVLNLDRFRFIDEGFGRRMADALLREISAALLAQSSRGDSVARIGPDEFMLLLKGLQDVRQINRRVQSILEVIARPRALAGRQMRVTASAGVALYPSQGSDFESLLGKASAALHVAKAASPGGIQIHSDDVRQRAQRRWKLEQDLHQALEHKKLSLFYQPQFELGSGNVCGVEALARWFHTDGDTIPPSVFIPMAEQSGMIEALGSWALRLGCASAAGWHAASIAAPICINVSALQICERFTCEIAAALETNGLRPEQLELEITESVLVENPDVALSALAQWKSLGIRIAVDDFGTGYCGLKYLSKLRIDRLKIDRSFVQGICEDSKDSTIVRAVVSLGKELGFAVLAEGVETPQQLRMLGELGCQQAQGFLLGRPLPAEQAMRMLQAQSAPHRSSRDVAPDWASRRFKPQLCV